MWKYFNNALLLLNPEGTVFYNFKFSQMKGLILIC